MGEPITRFHDGQRVRFVYADHPLTGEVGTVVRLRRADDAAWIEMDNELPRDCLAFSYGDPRDRHFMAYPEECESLPKRGTAGAGAS